MSIILRRRFGKQVIHYMKLHKIKYRDVMKALDVSHQTVHQWRTGKHFPTVLMLIKLAEYLRCTPNDLLLEPEPEPVKRPRTMEEILEFDRQEKAKRIT